MSSPDTPPSKLPQIILKVTFALVALTLVVGIVAVLKPARDKPVQDDFIRESTTGKSYLDQGEPAKAVEAFRRALAASPNHTNALLNLARAELQANQPEAALASARKALEIDHNAAAAYYIAGCSALRLGQFTNAVQYLQQAKEFDRTVNAVSFQLGRAYQQLGQWEAALEQLQEVVKFEPEHPAAYYSLSQVLLRLGQTDDARIALETHQNLHQGQPSQITDPSFFERCHYTQVQVPFKLQQPDTQGIAVVFADATSQAFPDQPAPWRGPAAVIDLNHDGHYSLFVREGTDGFRLLTNQGGVFHPFGDKLPGLPDAAYRRALVGDLNNDRVEDILVLGTTGSHAFKFTTNGLITDQSMFSRMKSVTASDGLLVDLDFTGKLDLVAWGEGTNTLRVYRNLGQPYFVDFTTNSGLPLSLTGTHQVVAEDWNGDDLLDLIVAGGDGVPALYVKQRGGPLAETNAPTAWPRASSIATADLNNDLQTDLVAAGPEEVTVVLTGFEKPWSLPAPKLGIVAVRVLDFDNDGWPDIAALGAGIRIWRNRGQAGYLDVTESLGLSPWPGSSGQVTDLTAADLDLDGDSDLLLTLANGELRVLRNDGGNGHQQLKLHLVGTKSNASGLGIRVELLAGGLRLDRRIHSLPIEIGVGNNHNVESLTARWFDFDVGTTDVPATGTNVLTFMELQIRDGSCPYVYVWNGERFRFVSDVLGASPLGLRISDDRFVESYPFEYIWLGDHHSVAPRGNEFIVQITEELREVMYLDETRLVAVDHPADTEVHPTSKLVPKSPFPEADLMTLHRRKPLRGAWTQDGREVTEALTSTDARMVSPERLRISQLRGLAEPYRVTLDFGELETDKPLVLALTGWLRYGGGMANVAASHNRELPFPFPWLEAEQSDGSWHPVDVTVGAPAGNTKTILVELEGKLPPGSRRLRLGTAFEIHWDRIALFEKDAGAETRRMTLRPQRSDLHWRGFSELLDLPPDQPGTPDYDRVRPAPAWRITPSGWCTRYGEVDALISATDNQLALVNGGDELTVGFPASELPEPATGMIREYFLYLVGWDKDSDFHVAEGARVEPLPWHGMDDQRYGKERRPSFPTDGWMEHYNTRWVGPKILARQGLKK